MPGVQTLLALDVGEKRTGVALASSQGGLPQPFGVLASSDNLLDKLRDIISERLVSVVVVGLPRGVEGQDTKQTKLIRDFAQQLQGALTVPIQLQDETLTSVKAEEELRA